MAEAGGAHVDRPRLAALLQLYTLAIGAYAACAALQPQIAALPGQAIVLAVHAGQPAAATSPVIGYFDALCVASGSGKQQKPPLPALLYVAQAVSSGTEHLQENWRSAALDHCMMGFSVVYRPSQGSFSSLHHGLLSDVLSLCCHTLRTDECSPQDISLEGLPHIAWSICRQAVMPRFCLS